MKFSVRLFLIALTVLLLPGLNGCLPSSQSQLEEEKEPHFLAGKSCINSLDYKGAIEQFEKAVEVNSRSASAHFQLGCLFEERELDPAAAIYHFERYLALRPNADNAEWIKLHIMNCKQDLAKSVLPLQVPIDVQHQVEQLSEEKSRLQEENEKWRAYFHSQNPTNVVTPTSTPVSARATQNASPTTGNTTTTVASPNPPPGNRSTPSATRTHSVQSGETPLSISRKYGIKLESLMAANPGLDSRHMRIGQPLNIPPP